MNCPDNKTFAKVRCKMCKNTSNISWLTFNDLHLGLDLSFKCPSCSAKTPISLKDLVENSVFK